MKINLTDEQVQVLVNNRIKQLVDTKVENTMKNISHNDIEKMLFSAIQDRITTDYCQHLSKQIDMKQMVKVLSMDLAEKIVEKMQDSYCDYD